MTYKALGRSITNHAAHVWNTNASESNIGKILCVQNKALRIITGSHKMSSIKETIFTRHNQNVLPLLANNRKDTLHTFGDEDG